ncbi:MAG TPA: methyl-accepting chemotaxis protein [Oleiagrimonas sp.]|nr:methyl-accepting chemotaxis protein [Oleiagrimonas sp.]
MKIKKVMSLFSKSMNLSVKARLTGVLVMLGVMLVLGAVVGLGMMSWQNNGMQRSYERAMVPAELLGQLRAKSLLNFTVLNEAAGLIGRPDQVKQKVIQSKKIHDEIEATSAKLDKIPMSKDIEAKYKKFVASNESYSKGLTSIYDALADGYKGTGNMVQMQIRPQLMMRVYALNKLIEAQGAQMHQIYTNQVDRYQTVRFIVLVGLLLGLIVAAVVSVLLVRSLTGTLKELSDVAYAIADGKLGHDIKVKRHDELGRLLEAFRVMDKRLVTIVGEVRHGSDAVSTASQQITRGNEGLSQRTQEQASSLVETASSMEEMTSTVKQSADNANHADQLARSARERAEHGGNVVREAVTAMAEIDAASNKISDIVRLIQDIAFQTNLLALNAAVEAARAGEQGRGFAVVASEVRNLAQRSADAATEIKGLINDSEDKVRTGSTLVNQSGEALSEIVTSVKKVTDIVAEIATSNQEQSVGIDQVSRAVNQIEEMTQQNSSLVEQASSAAHAMHDQAVKLSRQVAFFKINDSADADQPETPIAHAAEPDDDVARATEAVFAPIREQGSVNISRVDTVEDDWKEF